MLVHGYYTPNAWFVCYRYEYILLVLFVPLPVMGLVQYFGLWLSTWNIVLSYLSFETRSFRYVSFLLSSFLLISADLISVCVCLQECGSQWVWLENLQFSNCLLTISVWIFDLYSVLETCFGTWTFDRNLDWKLWSSTGNPDICRCSQNRFFYNCSIISIYRFIM